MKKILSTIGLSRRAGKIIFGFDAVCEEVTKPKSKAAGIILASDISVKSEKEVHFVCDKTGVCIIKADVSMDEIKDVLGKRTGIIAFLDKGLFDSAKNAALSN